MSSEFKFHVLKLFCLYVKILLTSRESANATTDREDRTAFPSLPGFTVVDSVGSDSNTLLHRSPVQQRVVMASSVWYVQLALHPTSYVSVPFVKTIC